MKTIQDVLRVFNFKTFKDNYFPWVSNAIFNRKAGMGTNKNDKKTNLTVEDNKLIQTGFRKFVAEATPIVDALETGEQVDHGDEVPDIDE